MIERLNFYDIYGYLLPGFTFLTILWLPFGLINQELPSLGFSYALGFVVFAYIVGHLLQRFVERALPSKSKDKKGNSRYPSDILLDNDDGQLSSELKAQFFKKVMTQFDLDLSDQSTKDVTGRQKIRQDAFFLCRRSLIQMGIASYAEQFEGMYALMRGITAACLVGASYYLGWGITGYLQPHKDADVFLGALAIALIIPAVLDCKKGRAFWILIALFGVLGGLFGSNQIIALKLYTVLLASAATLLFVSLRFYEAYSEFSVHFAKTVYRDFCAHDLLQ